MKLVVQRGRGDSAIACVAMLCGVPYDVASAHLRSVAPLSTLSTGYLVRALRHFGREPGGDRVQQLNGMDVRHLKSDALLWSYGYRDKALGGQTRFNHWAVWDHRARTVKDPLTEPHELTPRSFLLMA